MSASPPAPDDFLARFQRKIAANAAAWLAFLDELDSDPAALDRELANLTKAAQQALLEPQAWDNGLALVSETWRYVELRGYWQNWQALLTHGVEVSRQTGRTHFEALLLDQLGEAARLAGDNRAAHGYFQASLACFRALGDQRGMGRALSHLSQVQLVLNDWDSAARSCREAAGIFEDLKQPDDLGLAHNNWGLICQEQEQFVEALAHFDLAEAAFRAADNRRGQAKTLVNRSVVFRLRQELDGAARYLQEAITLYEQIGDPLHSASTQMNLSILLYETGRPAEALALSLEAEQVFRRLHHRPFLARICNNHGMFLAALGRMVEAQEAFDESTRLHLENGDRLYAAHALCNCAEILIDQGSLADGSSYLEQAQSLLASLPERPQWLMRECEIQRSRLEKTAGAQPAA
jgi:tetratricopeptide (TPR) repeat protein